MPQQDVAVGRGSVVVGEGWGVVSPSELLPPAVGVVILKHSKVTVKEFDL